MEETNLLIKKTILTFFKIRKICEFSKLLQICKVLILNEQNP